MLSICIKKATIGSLIAFVVLARPGSGAAQTAAPLRVDSFTEIATQGLGDRQNSWAWSMEWFQGKLYVGTLRSYLCLFRAAVDLGAWTYPPSDGRPADCRI